jgi:hypothetical protein
MSVPRLSSFSSLILLCAVIGQLFENITETSQVPCIWNNDWVIKAGVGGNAVVTKILSLGTTIAATAVNELV